MYLGSEANIAPYTQNLSALALLMMEEQNLAHDISGKHHRKKNKTSLICCKKMLKLIMHMKYKELKQNL